jgi:UDP-N-acetylmuramoyl-L-alanyl-D-glutamate--2,6-diaminopimelate ligase
MARWFVDRSAQRGIPSVSLRRLLPDATFNGISDLHVSGCAADSRRLEPGEVFVAIPGHRHDGHDFIPQALGRGAAAVIVQRPCPEAGRLQVIVQDSRLAHARLCHALAGSPGEALRVVGVLGIAGKSVTALFVRSILEAAGERVGLIGPETWSDGVRGYPAGPSPIGAEALGEMLAAMVDRRCEDAVVSLSRAIVERRAAEGITLDAALITRARPFDESPTDRRGLARLVRRIGPGGAAIVNADDPESDLLGAVNLEARRVSFAIGTTADVTATIDRLDARGARFRLHGFDREATVGLRLIGSRNVTHALAAAALAWARGLDPAAVVAGLEAVECIPGRLESLAAEGFDVRLARARSGLELRETLLALRESGLGPIHCVLAVDPAAADEMAGIALEGSDRVTLTTAAARRAGRVRLEPDRRRAIESALADARPGDLILIAGPGRPARPILDADRPMPGDDRALADRWLRQHRPARRRSA